MWCQWEYSPPFSVLRQSAWGQTGFPGQAEGRQPGSHSLHSDSPTLEQDSHDYHMYPGYWIQGWLVVVLFLTCMSSLRYKRRFLRRGSCSFSNRCLAAITIGTTFSITFLFTNWKMKMLRIIYLQTASQEIISWIHFLRSYLGDDFSLCLGYSCSHLVPFIGEIFSDIPTIKNDYWNTRRIALAPFSLLFTSSVMWVWSPCRPIWLVCPQSHLYCHRPMESLHPPILQSPPSGCS